MLISHAFLADIDEAKSHYDVRSIYSHQLGEALALQFDKNVAQVGLLAAASSATITGGEGGTALTQAGLGSDPTAFTGAQLASQIYSAAEALDDNFIPESERYAFMKPDLYYKLVQETSVINKDFDGQGSYGDGTVYNIAGIGIVKSTNMPRTNITTGPAAYQINATTMGALVMHKSAVGTVKLIDMALESEYDIRRQGTLMLAKYAIGHGILRPEAAVSIAAAV